MKTAGIKYAVHFIVILNVFVSTRLSAETNYTFTLHAEDSEIYAYEGLNLDVILCLSDPNLYPESYSEITTIQADMNFIVKKEDSTASEVYIYPMEFLPDNSTANCYLSQVYLIYNYSFNDFVFSEPGTYHIKMENSTNEIDINVKPAPEAQILFNKIIHDPNDYVSILTGTVPVQDIPKEDFEKYESAISQCKSVFMAKALSANLGLYYFEQFYKNHRSFSKYKVDFKGTKTPYLEKAEKYLSLARTLPESFILKEKVLNNLAIVMYINNEYENAYECLDKLAQDYPKGKYGKKAQKAKRELQAIETKEKQNKEI